MKRFFTYMRETVIAGLFLLLPIMVMVILLGRLWQMVHGIIGKITGKIGQFEIGGLTVVVIFTVLVVLLICFLAGLLIRLSIISSFQGWLEKHILRFIPGYTYLKLMLLEKMTHENSAKQLSVLVKIGDAWQPAILVEQQGDQCTVYVPIAPQATSGHIYLVNSSQVNHLHISLHAFQESIEQFGKGFSPTATTQV